MIQCRFRAGMLLLFRAMVLSLFLYFVSSVVLGQDGYKRPLSFWVVSGNSHVGLLRVAVGDRLVLGGDVNLVQALWREASHADLRRYG